MDITEMLLAVGQQKLHRSHLMLNMQFVSDCGKSVTVDGSQAAVGLEKDQHG